MGHRVALGVGGHGEVLHPGVHQQEGDQVDHAVGVLVGLLEGLQPVLAAAALAAVRLLSGDHQGVPGAVHHGVAVRGLLAHLAEVGRDRAGLAELPRRAEDLVEAGLGRGGRQGRHLREEDHEGEDRQVHREEADHAAGRLGGGHRGGAVPGDLDPLLRWEDDLQAGRLAAEGLGVVLRGVVGLQGELLSEELLWAEVPGEGGLAAVAQGAWGAKETLDR